MLWYVICSIGQWVACILLAGGITIEVIYQADLGFLAVTVGSGLFALVTKLKAGGKDAAIQALLAKIHRQAGRRKGR